MDAETVSDKLVKWTGVRLVQVDDSIVENDNTSLRQPVRPAIFQNLHHEDMTSRKEYSNACLILNSRAKESVLTKTSIQRGFYFMNNVKRFVL